MNSYKTSEHLFSQAKGILRFAIVVAFLSCSTVSANSDSRVANSVHTLSPLSARYLLIHKPSQEILASFNIMIGEDGLRIDQIGDGASGSVILNSHLDKMWLLDRGLKIFHEVPLQINNSDSTEIDSSGNERTNDELETQTGYFAAFIQLEPCSGMQSEKLSDSESTPVHMQIWHCRHDNKIVEKQWFDNRYGFVVKSESFDGIVATINDIKTLPTLVEYFEPPSQYRKVALDEILLITQPLNTYNEKNSSL